MNKSDLRRLTQRSWSRGSPGFEAEVIDYGDVVIVWLNPHCGFHKEKLYKPREHNKFSLQVCNYEAAKYNRWLKEWGIHYDQRENKNDQALN